MSSPADNDKTIFDETPIGPSFHLARLATAAALPAYTQAGAGVGATLTMNAVGVLTVDGTAPALNDVIFLDSAHAAAAEDSGLYKLSTVGTGGIAAILTRVTGFDQAAAGEIEQGAGIQITAGATKINNTYILTTSGVIVPDTTALTFIAGNGDTDVVLSSIIELPMNGAVNLGMTVFVEETVAPLVGELRVKVANGTAAQKKAGSLRWLTYPDLAAIGTGPTVDSDGVIGISGDEEFPIDLDRMKFTYVQLEWTGDTGEGTITTIVAAQGSN